MKNIIEFGDLMGSIIDSVVITDEKNEFIITLNNKEQYKLYHKQECCESVYIEDIVGDISDIIGAPLLVAEEVHGETGDEELEDTYTAYTWTYYKLDTNKGGITIRWYGTSNGNYSEKVSFGKTI